MTDIKSFVEANRELRTYIPESKSQMNEYKLGRMTRLMEYLGNPQNNYKVIHVAGTSGKTSTCYYLSALLKVAGKKVGMTISPHIDEINERVQINLIPLDEKTYCRELSIFIEHIKTSKINPTYFELLVAFAFWEFDRQKVDYAVIEVGVGGLLDGTNVISNNNKVSVITDIGLDHVEILGNSLKEIAAQKAGIILPNSHAFTHIQNKQVNDVIRKVCIDKKAVLHEISFEPANEHNTHLPLFQTRNWHLALEVHKYLVVRDNMQVLSKIALESAAKTHIPARMEIINYKDKTIVLDGAHNSQKLAALIAGIKDSFKNKEVTVIAAFVNTKQSLAHANLELLSTVTHSLFLTGFDDITQTRTSIDPKILGQICESIGFHQWEIVNHPDKALEKALKTPPEIILITGSFYLLNHVRPILLSNL